MKYLNCQSYLDDIGKRIKQYRVSLNMTQQDLADKSGVSKRSISRIEQGESSQMETFIKILMALDLIDNFDLLIPDQTVRPSFYLENNKKTRQRVRKPSNSANEFKWGDEE